MTCSAHGRTEAPGTGMIMVRAGSTHDAEL